MCLWPQILSEAKDPLKIQPFVKKCFEAVKEFDFESNGEISGLISVENERIQWIESVNPATTGACRSPSGPAIFMNDLFMPKATLRQFRACNRIPPV